MAKLLVRKMEVYKDQKEEGSKYTIYMYICIYIYVYISWGAPLPSKSDDQKAFIFVWDPYNPSFAAVTARGASKYIRTVYFCGIK